ncbi:flavin-nucleotide-binding protein [Mesorhizobium sp. Root157]|uniref:pyridoxamine 5'-phosphate oxidase family protein n=1 Tax=Mesorhizobium sp. Root157 TaxID=1736477 RepID=UPI0006F67D39|nr:pyridoxamine 5'-phosphate oxidase family protein [Mesorhizobium sp. Root157]KQZ87362.1 flavin-nucleotide-binding protein [Mesorhizobium sp. Root157]
MIIAALNKSECKALLSSARLGRLACCNNGQPYVVPIQFVAEGAYLYSFSLLGQKIDWMRANPLVCVQVDEFGKNREWRSVVVNGRYEELPDRIGWKTERDHAWSLLSQHANWWEPGGMKPVPEGATPHLFYRIIIDEMTGRRAEAVS